MPRKAMTKTTNPTVEEKVDQKPKEEVKEFAPHDGIICRSVWAGGLNVTCRSGNFYEFKDYGDTAVIEYQDLAALARKRSDHIFIPRFIIEDEDFLNEFPQIRDFYADVYSEGDLKAILRLPANQMSGTISKLPEAVLPTIRSLAATMVGNGEIDSVRTIKTLTAIFGADFNLLSELFADN